MSGKNPRFENLDCPVEAGETCVMPDRRVWGLDKSVNPVYVTALVGLIVGILIWAGGPEGVNSHFSSLGTASVQQAKDIESVKGEVRDLKRDTKEDLKQINDKLDRLIERRR